MKNYNDMDATIELLDKNHINHHETQCFDELNYLGFTIWLDKGHFEFDNSGRLTKVVTW